MRKIVLPCKYSKGNLLSTLFALFLGISERIIVFEKRISQKKRLLAHRYVRQGFIIVASLLFILASVEWTDAPAKTCQIISSGQPQTNKVLANSVSIKATLPIESERDIFYSYPEQPFPIVITVVPSLPVFLRVRNIRI